jgi:lactate dehydrogenase-like 2-hydroxyacid dehydrogenase
LKPDLIAIDSDKLQPSHIKMLEAEFTVHHVPPSGDRAAFVKPIADSVRFASTSAFIGLKADLMQALPKLEIIANFGVGTDSIDVKAATARGIAVTNTPDVLNICVADLAIGLIIACARRIAQGDRHVRAGKWLQGDLPLGGRVSGKRLGILGLGKIGKMIAKRAAAFDMEISYNGRKQQAVVPYRFYSDLAEMAANVDFLVAICPGGPETRHLVNERVIHALGPKGTLINVSRGSVVQEQALLKALQSGALGAAALDVFEAEPKVPPAFFELDNVVLMPHTGSGTIDTRTAMGDLVVANLLAQLHGQKLPTRCN